MDCDDRFLRFDVTFCLMSLLEYIGAWCLDLSGQRIGIPVQSLELGRNGRTDSPGMPSFYI